MRRQLVGQAFAHEGMPEAEAALGGLDHQGGQRELELGVGLVLGAVGDGQELVGAEGQAQQRDPLERAQRRGRQGSRHRAGAVGAGSRHLEHGEREAGCRLGDLLRCLRVQLGEPFRRAGVAPPRRSAARAGSGARRRAQPGWWRGPAGRPEAGSRCASTSTTRSSTAQRER